MHYYRDQLTMEQRDILNNLLDQHDVVTLDDVRSCFGLTNDKARILFEEYLSSLSSKMDSFEVQYAISGYKTEEDHDDLPIHRFMIVDRDDLSEREQYFTKVTSKYLFQIGKNKANQKHCQNVRNSFDRMFCSSATQNLDTVSSSIKIKNPNCKLREKEPLRRVDLDGNVLTEARPIDLDSIKQTVEVKRKLEENTIVKDEPPTKKTATEQKHCSKQSPKNETVISSQSQSSQSVKSSQNTQPVKQQILKPTQKKQASIMSFFKKV